MDSPAKTDPGVTVVGTPPTPVTITIPVDLDLRDEATGLEVSRDLRDQAETLLQFRPELETIT